MDCGPRTPEELETLLEDAYVVRDAEAVASLYEDGAVVARPHAGQARGPQEIARAAADAWGRGAAFVAAPEHVVQARSTALVVGPRSVSVARRGPDGAWRYAIALMEIDEEAQEG